MIEVTLFDFTQLLTPVLESYGRERLSFRYNKAVQTGILSEKDCESFNRVLIWKRELTELIPLYYDLYNGHKSTLDNETLRDEFLTKFRSFWKFVRCSKEFLALPFFQQLYPVKMAKIDPRLKTIQKFQEVFEKNCQKCADLGLTAEIIYNSTHEELKWALKQDRMFLTVGEKLKILQIHREYCC